MNNITIIGAGAYGTALAERFSWNAQNKVALMSIEEDVVESINSTHTNDKYFPGRRLTASITASGSYSCLEGSNVVLLAVPSFAVEPVALECAPYLNESSLLVNLAKGLALDGALIYSKLTAPRCATLKGPTFAVELFNGLPSALTFASENDQDFNLVREICQDTGIFLDYSTDVRGVEFLSVLKNIYAIALGIVAGRYNSPNVDFIVLTKAISEMKGFLELEGCDPNSIFNYCGVGDLGLTALNDLSRNRTLGLLIGKGFLGDSQQSSVVMEGLRSVQILARKVLSTDVEQIVIPPSPQSSAENHPGNLCQ